MSNKELPMSKGALRLIAHVEIKRLKSYLPQAQAPLGHWKFLVGYWTFPTVPTQIPPP